MLLTEDFSQAQCQPPNSWEWGIWTESALSGLLMLPFPWERFPQPSDILFPRQTAVLSRRMEAVPVKMVPSDLRTAPSGQRRHISQPSTITPDVWGHQLGKRTLCFVEQCWYALNNWSHGFGPAVKHVLVKAQDSAKSPTSLKGGRKEESGGAIIPFQEDLKTPQ